MCIIYNSFEKKFAGFIAKRNTEKYVNRKLSFEFLLLALLGAVSGIIAFSEICRHESYSLEYVIYHLDSTLKNCVLFSDYFSEILNTSKPDIRNLFFIFISGFTYFCWPACAVMIFSKGFLYGFSALYLAEALVMLDIPSGRLVLIIFIASRVLLSAVAIYLATISCIFSYRFREIKSNRSVLRRAPITYKYFFIFIYSTGGILLINYIYCFFIYNILR